MRPLLATGLALLALATGGRAEEPPARPVAVIVSARRGTSDVSAADLRRMFLGQITRWPDGRRIQLYVRPAGNVEQRALLERVVRMTDIDFSRHWLGQVFRGEAASPPRTIESSEMMQQIVRTNADAVGLVLMPDLAADSQRNLRVLSIDGKSVSDERYILRP